MSLLIPDTGLLFWMILSFGIAFFILARFGFPMILKGVEKRNEFIAQSVESAKEANAKLASIENECQTLLA
ncbi:ATP synthase F0 subunit B, partial [Macellibacteroides fermentans]|nr:ATP synthase F0 subunit B [Macellibacteroides fermentans]